MYFATMSSAGITLHANTSDAATAIRKTAATFQVQQFSRGGGVVSIISPSYSNCCDWGRSLPLLPPFVLVLVMEDMVILCATYSSLLIAL
jgi:hypothetical protein